MIIFRIPNVFDCILAYPSYCYVCIGNNIGLRTAAENLPATPEGASPRWSSPCCCLNYLVKGLFPTLCRMINHVGVVGILEQSCFFIPLRSVSRKRGACAPIPLGGGYPTFARRSLRGALAPLLDILDHLDILYVHSCQASSDLCAGSSARGGPCAP